MSKTYSPFSPPPAPGHGQRSQWRELHGSAVALAVGRAALANSGVTLIVTADSASAQRFQREFEFATPELQVLEFPDWETLPYDLFSPHQDITSERLATLHALRARMTAGGSAPPVALLVPIQTLLQRVVPVTYVDAYALELRTGQQFDAHDYRRRLEAAGYQAVETVGNRGEYAIRGSLMDIFPMGLPTPIRIDLFDDEIESLRTFDTDTQRTLEHVPAIRVLPAREHPFDDAAIGRFRDRWHNTFNVDVRRCSVYQDVSQRIPSGGIEYYLPLFFEELATLLDYLPADTLVIEEHGAAAAADQHWQEIRSRHDNLAHDVERPILDPERLFVETARLRERLNQHGRIVLDGSGRHEIVFATRAIPVIEANPRARDPAEPLTRFLRGHTGRVLFVADTAGRREVLADFLRRAQIRTREVPGFSDFLATDERAGITIAPVARGFWLDELAVVTESEIFGHQVTERRQRAARTLDPDQIIRNLTELHVGDPVVHIEHGIGRYLGLVTLDIDGNTNEYLALAYAEEAKLYVPVTSLHLISRYTGADGAHAPLHRLGSDQWEKARRRAAEKAYDVAAELLDIYARREASARFRFTDPGLDYQRFADQFPFEVTPDQQRAIDEVIADLCSERSTDRLICGDVGFGKTEVAMRAAFLAVQSGKQVAVLVPTTLLAQQHHENFRDRFADWPVRVESVSRLRSDGEVTSLVDQLAAGKIDILIGTHKLLGQMDHFRDLGLVIVDEEHRFGVRQKEKMRTLRAEVDVLTLTATPIPRTLNMAMTGMRDLSVIATPPARRLSIKTFVMERNRSIIQDAINRELRRGGQVFYVHNEVRTIAAVALELAEWLPDARIGVGHGQMPARELERVMNDFYHRQLNLLLCSTIIETGIDIPNANTIVIDRADKLGLAQLHQLRGRVGRSHRQAYAYLLTPHPKAMTTDAVKRLEAIEAAGELGIGFTLATHDMEIRGAGELLGEEQHGQIESVGFSLYMDMLERAVQAIRAGRAPDLDKPLQAVGREVNLHAAARIPDDYLPDVHARLILYKRIANATTPEQLDDLRAEVVDRFGMPPQPLRQLFQITGLKLRMQPLGIDRLDLGDAGGKVEFGATTSVDPLTVVRLVQSFPSTYRLEGGANLRISRKLATFDERVQFADELLDTLATAPVAIRAGRS
jgi:transcription-repair coupling factor (superfamily II helicase)